MLIVGLLSLFVLVGSHVSLAWVELLVLGALVGKMFQSPCWVELIILETWLDKCSGARW